MYTPFNSKLFTTHIDPVSNIRISVLSARVAPIQQGFYFINSGWSDDKRFYWFQCAFPPAVSHVLAVIDFLTDEIRYFPETQGGTMGIVDGRTGNLYWGNIYGIYMRTPYPDDKPVQIAKLPEECRKAVPKQVGTHITFTPDHKELLVDIMMPNDTIIGTFDIATGAFQEWYRTDGLYYNHAQMNPVDPDVCLCAHEHSYDGKKGVSVKPPLENGIYPRLNIITRNGKRKMIPPMGNYATHEWWAPDGKSIFYCNSTYRGEKEVTAIIAQDFLDGSDPQIVCRVVPGGSTIAHGSCSADQKYFVFDGFEPNKWWRGAVTMLYFCNRETGKQICFLSKNPVVEGWTPENPCPYHIDPHPRFVLNDSLITFTTTICGRVDVAMVSVEELIEATK